MSPDPNGAKARQANRAGPSEIIAVTPDGSLRLGGQVFQCALGSGGIVADKVEGDHATPAGCYPLRRVMYRADRIDAPAVKLPICRIRQQDGWCDAPDHPDYNRLVVLPFDSSHEALWRDDHLYDVVVEVGYNDDPPVPGKGSAIFMHVAKDGYAPTEGCVALEITDLLRVLARCGASPMLRIQKNS